MEQINEQLSEFERINAFNRDLSNYVLINNHIMRKDFHKPWVLNPTPVHKDVFFKKFGFTDDHYRLLPELDGVCCVPAHGDDYRSIVNGKWNEYSFVEFTAEPGNWPTIEKLIKHVFGSNEVEPLDQTEDYYDRLQLLITRPWEKQHGLLLYSHHQGTSKSAVALLESLILKENFSRVDSNVFEEQFNASWATKLVVNIDEPAFENKKKASRKLRDAITSPTIQLRKMQKDPTPIDLFVKFIITTNDTDCMPFEPGDRRWWIREVMQIPTEDKDPYFEDKMRSEINHFIHFLLNRQMKNPVRANQTFWHSDDLIKTNGFKKLVKDNVNETTAAIGEILESWFLEHPDYKTCMFTNGTMKSELATYLKMPESRIKTLEITQALRDFYKVPQPTETGRITKGNGALDPTESKKNGKFWCVNRSIFISTTDKAQVHSSIFEMEKIKM